MFEKRVRPVSSCANRETPIVDDEYCLETLEVLTAYRSISNDRVRLALKELIEIVASEARTDERTA